MVVSDLPLDQLVSSPFYQLGVVASYVVAMVPVLFVLLAGFTMVRLRNMFKPLASGILIGVWMLAVAGTAVAAANLAPAITSHLSELATQAPETRTYDYEKFTELHVDGEINVTVVPSSTTSVAVSGRPQDLDRLEFTLEDGQLRVTQRSRQEVGVWCLVCMTKPVALTVTGPKIEVLDARQPAWVERSEY
jgi:hypothetical protein